MDKGLISVVIPVYNREKYIKECIDSVLNQTYQNFEIIIVDDGSTDKTVEIIESINDERIKLFKNNHLGVSEATNFAFKQINGEYIALLDSDDTMISDRLEYQFNYMENNQNIDVIVGELKFDWRF